MPGRLEEMREAAEVFADELARMGYSAQDILALFTSPVCVQAYAALRELGEPAIRDVIVRAVVRTARSATSVVGKQRGLGSRATA
jgi:hypothetical protein